MDNLTLNSMFWTIAATAAISALSFAGVFALALKEKKLNKVLLFLVSLSAGTLIGGAFLHLLPEAAGFCSPSDIFYYSLGGFVFFFMMEKVLAWRHCHEAHCPRHSFGYLNLAGDGIHNFIDGLVIAAAFSADFRLGWVTAAAMAMHELPQEIGDFGVLLYSGFGKGRALLMNFLSASLAIAGGIAGIMISGPMNEYIRPLLAFAAGGFLYIAAVDLIPEINKETKAKNFFKTFAVFLLGIALMALLRNLG